MNTLSAFPPPHTIFKEERILQEYKNNNAKKDTFSIMDKEWNIQNVNNEEFCILLIAKRLILNLYAIDIHFNA